MKSPYVNTATLGHRHGSNLVQGFGWNCVQSGWRKSSKEEAVRGWSRNVEEWIGRRVGKCEISLNWLCHLQELTSVF